MNLDKISAIILTRGGYPIDDIVASLHGFEQIIVADNSKSGLDRKVYLRWIAARQARHEIIYVQDDDCIVDAKALVEKYNELMSPMVCNMPKDRRDEYARRPGHISLVGWGAVFNRFPVNANIDRYRRFFPQDELFDRECDRVVTYLTPHIDVEVKFEHLPRAHGNDRMGREARHGDDLTEICARLLKLPI